MPLFDDARPQVGDLGDPQPLRVPGFVDQPSAGGPAKPIDDRLGQLATALGSFNTAVGQFGRQYSIAQREHPAAQNKADAQDWDQYRNTHTASEVIQAGDAGTLPRYASPDVQRRVDIIHGHYVGQQLADDVTQKVGTGELKWEDGSAQTYLDQQRQAILQQHGWTPDSAQAAGFGASFNAIQHNASQQAIRANVQNVQQDHAQAASQAVDMAVGDAFKAKLPPDQAWKKIETISRQMAVGLHMTADELDGIAYSALMRRSSQDPNWVLAVGRAPRTDMDDGKSPAGPLFSKQQYLTPTTQLQQQADQLNAKRADADAQDKVGDQIGQMLQDQPQAVHNLPQQVTYSDPGKGVYGQVDRDKVLKDQVNAIISRDNQRVATGQATADQVQNEQLYTFAQSGQRQHQWADTLNSAAKGGLDPQTLTDPSRQGQALAAYKLYSDLSTKNPAYLHTLMTPETEKFFTSAKLQQQLFNRSPIEALQAASQINAPAKSENEGYVLQAQRQTIDQKASQLDFGQGWFGGPVKNPYIAREALAQAAEGLVRFNGMRPEDAVKSAMPVVQDHFVNINGSLVPDLHYLPKETMKPAAEKWLSDWATGPAKALNLDPSKLTLQPAGQGQFMVVDGDSGMPITGRQNGGRGGFTYVTAPQLIQTAKGLGAAAHAAQQQSTDQAATAASKVISGRRDAPIDDWRLSPF